MAKANEILAILKEMLPEVRTELAYENLYQLTVAVVLSAQATDVAVNKATPALFARYPDFTALAQADYDELREMIKTIGLAPTKAESDQSEQEACVREGRDDRSRSGIPFDPSRHRPEIGERDFERGIRHTPPRRRHPCGAGRQSARLGGSDRPGAHRGGDMCPLPACGMASTAPAVGPFRPVSLPGAETALPRMQTHGILSILYKHRPGGMI